jgi:hypothetical protein
MEHFAKVVEGGVLFVLAVGCDGPRPAPPDGAADVPQDTAAADVAREVSAADAWAPPLECRGEPSPGAGVFVRGHAFAFGPGGGRVRDGYVTAEELPGRCARTDRDGAFALQGFAAGGTATLRLHHPDHNPIQTGTLEVLPEGLERVTFQAPDHSTYRVLELVLRLEADPSRCQLATTVTRVGLSLYDSSDHGEAEATVTIDPPLSAPAEGPIYFEYLNAQAIIPDRRLRQTTRDGGVLFLNVPPGDYTLTAHKPGVRFTTVRMRCRAGLLVNASPPWGLQALP